MSNLKTFCNLCIWHEAITEFEAICMRGNKPSSYKLDCKDYDCKIREDKEEV